MRALARDGQQVSDVIQEGVHGTLATEQGYLLVVNVPGTERARGWSIGQAVLFRRDSVKYTDSTTTSVCQTD